MIFFRFCCFIVDNVVLVALAIIVVVANAVVVAVAGGIAGAVMIRMRILF